MKGHSHITVFAMACIALCAFTISVDSQGQSAVKTSGLTEELTKKLSLKPEQAAGAAGSVFSLAKSKMNPADFTKLAGGFPEMDAMLKAAPAVTSPGGSAVSGALGSTGGAMALASQFKSLGITPETATKIVPEVLNFVKGKQGDAMMGLLSKAVK